MATKRALTVTRLISLLSCLGFLPSIASAQSSYPFVPEEFEVPEQLETRDFRIRMLTIHDAVKDYAYNLAYDPQERENLFEPLKPPAENFEPITFVVAVDSRAELENKLDASKRKQGAAALDAAATLASQLHAELEGIFVQDINLARLAELRSRIPTLRNSQPL